jgi:hypothetical protein
MADKQSRLAEIYKAEKSKGGGIASTLGKRALEKMDPRQFFNQKGFLAASLPSLFKSYSATPTKSGAKIASLGSGSLSSGALETKMDILTGETRELKIHSKLAAKNSVVLPSMARDMNVMRQNIVKLVKLQGGTATTKADMFFKRAGDREAGYESRFSKEKFKTSTSPTKVGEDKKDSKSGIFGILSVIFSLITGAIGKIVKTAISSVGGILSSVGGVLSLLASGLTLIVSSIGSIGKGLLSTIGFLSKIPFIGKFFKAAALIGAGVGLYNILKPNKEGEETTEDDTSEGPGVLDSITEKGTDLLNQGKETFGKYGGVAAGGIATIGAASVASKVMGAGGLAAKTGTAVLDARTMSVGQLEKSTPTSRWGKFLSFVAKKSPTLFGRIGVKLAQAGALMAIPFAGWIGAALQLGFTFWTAWELFELWREFTNSKEDEEEQNKSPTLSTSTTPIVEGAGGAAFGMYSKPGMEPQKDSSGASTTANGMKNYKSRAGVNRESSSTTPTPTAPTSAPASKTPSANKTALDITASTESGGRYDLAFGDAPQRDGTIVNVLGKSKNFPQLAGKIIMTPKDFSGKPLNEMTLAEVKEFQEYRNREAPNTNAVGKYQFMRTTLFGKDGKSGLVGQLKLPMDTIFNADTQELLQATMREGNAATLKKEGVAVTDANLNLANAVGAKGTAELLKPENADRNALDVLGLTGAAAKTNPQLNKLSKDVIAETYSKYDASGMAPGGSSGTVVASASAPSSKSVAASNLKMPTMGTLAAAAPTMGDMIEAATSAFSDITRVFDTAMASVTNVTNNNTQSSAGAQQSQGALPSVYDDVFLNLFQRVT